MQEEFTQLKALMLARSYLYELFHKALGGAPTAELLEFAVSDATADALDEYAGANNVIETFASFLAGIDVSHDGFLEQVRSEYNRLFVGLGRPGLLLWESPYVSGEPFLLGESALNVRSFYRGDGLQAKGYPNVPEDHLSIMLKFMALSAERSYRLFKLCDFDRLTGRLVNEALFVERHLNNWLGDVVSCLSVRSECFYSQVVRAIAAYVEADAMLLIEARAWLDERKGDIAVFDAEEENAFARMEGSLSRLQQMRLPFLEENELVLLADTSLV